jgi:inward rectifier potassium channel
MDGVPTLMMRVGNERGNLILEATIRVSIVRTETTREGVLFYRMYDLALTRERSPAMNRSWTVLHPIAPGEPPPRCHARIPRKRRGRAPRTVVGVDDTSMQPVHARRRYYDYEIVWGARHADILTEQPDGSLVVDMRRFHQLVPTQPIEGFPYPRPTGRTTCSRPPVELSPERFGPVHDVRREKTMSSPRASLAVPVLKEDAEDRNVAEERDLI